MVCCELRAVREMEPGRPGEGVARGRVAEQFKFWRSMLGASKGHVGRLEGGLIDLPTEYVWGLPHMNPGPQTAKDLAFGIGDLTSGCKTGVYERMPSSRKRQSSGRGSGQGTHSPGLLGEFGLCGITRGRRGREGHLFGELFAPKQLAQALALLELRGELLHPLHLALPLRPELQVGERLISFDLTAGF